MASLFFPTKKFAWKHSLKPCRSTGRSKWQARQGLPILANLPVLTGASMRCRIHRLGFLGGLGALALGFTGCLGFPTMPDQGPPPEVLAQEIPQANKRLVHVVFLGGIDPVAAHEFKNLFVATRQSGYTRSYHAEFWTAFDCGWVRQELFRQLEANQGNPQSVVIISQDQAWKAGRDLADALAQAGYGPDLVIEIDPPGVARRAGNAGLSAELVQIVPESLLGQHFGEYLTDSAMTIQGAKTWTLPMHPTTREVVQDRLAQVATSMEVTPLALRPPLLDPGPDTPRVVPPGAPPLVPLPGPGWVPGSGPWPGRGAGQPPAGMVPVLPPPRGLPGKDPWDFLEPRAPDSPKPTELPIMPRKVPPAPLLPGEIRPGLGT